MRSCPLPPPKKSIPPSRAPLYCSGKEMQREKVRRECIEEKMVSSLFTLSPTAGIRPAHSRANAFAFGSLRMRRNFGGPVGSCLLGASATLLSHSLQERERGVKGPKEKIGREIDGF